MYRGKARKFLGQLVLPPTGLWTQIRVCPCCGRFVVRLRLADRPRKRITCYFNGWDGSPWYTPPDRVGPRNKKGSKYETGNAIRHNPWGKSEWKEPPPKREPPAKVEDPFFTLDTE